MDTTSNETLDQLIYRTATPEMKKQLDEEHQEFLAAARRYLDREEEELDIYTDSEIPALNFVLPIDEIDTLACAVNTLKELGEARVDEANMILESYDPVLTESLFTISTWATRFIESLQ